MPHLASRNLLFPLAASLLVSSVAARADLKWTETMTMGQKKGAMSISTTKWMNKNARRTSTSMAMGPIKTTTNELTLCETNQQFLLDDDLKLYAETVFNLNNPMPKIPSMGGGPFGGGIPGAPKPAKGPKKTGTQEISFTITDAGTEKIAGFDTKHYIIESSITSTGCAGKGIQKMKIETWQANIDIPAPCFKPSADSSIKAATTARVESDCDVKTTFKTDISEMNKAFNGFVMRTRFGEGEQQMTNEVTMLSQAAIPDSEFALPEGYKKVTEEELNKAKSQAMMKSIMGGGMFSGLGNIPGMPDLSDLGGE